MMALSCRSLIVDVTVDRLEFDILHCANHGSSADIKPGSLAIGHALCRLGVSFALNFDLGDS